MHQSIQRIEDADQGSLVKDWSKSYCDGGGTLDGSNELIFMLAWRRASCWTWTFDSSRNQRAGKGNSQVGQVTPEAQRRRTFTPSFGSYCEGTQGQGKRCSTMEGRWYCFWLSTTLIIRCYFLIADGLDVGYKIGYPLQDIIDVIMKAACQEIRRIDIVFFPIYSATADHHHQQEPTFHQTRHSDTFHIIHPSSLL